MASQSIIEAPTHQHFWPAALDAIEYTARSWKAPLQALRGNALKTPNYRQQKKQREESKRRKNEAKRQRKEQTPQPTAPLPNG
jgi:hypothetical protein